MSDYIYLLESRLSKDQLQLLVQVQSAAEHAQAHVFLAGGAVRDLLGGFPIRDLDFAVEGPALKLVKHLDRRLFTVVSEDERRQSAELLFGGEWTLEISMARRETYAKTGGPPEVARGTIQDDLMRRDFSVNAVALSLNQASRGLLLDPTNGLADIEHKELRALSNYSFFDDPIRLLRLVRFEQRLKYAPAERTKTQFASAREAGVEQYITPHARLHELRQLAAEPQSAGIVQALADTELLGVFEPHLSKKVDFQTLARFEKYRLIVDAAGQRFDALGPFLYCLTRKLSPAEKKNLRVLSGLRASEAAAWLELEARGRALQKIVASKQGTPPSKLFRLLDSQDPAVAVFLLAFSPVQTVRERIKNYFTYLRPLAQSLEDKEVEAAGVKRDSPKFAAAREAYLTTKLDKKPVKPEAEAPVPPVPPS
jgi:tRNA nucleotidyltransferase/poly(A) polymerase